jgi:hypothetical protein
MFQKHKKGRFLTVPSKFVYNNSKKSVYICVRFEETGNTIRKMKIRFTAVTF